MKYNLKYHAQCMILLLTCLGMPLTVLATDTGSVLPNGNTADGSGVLISRTTGIANSGFGFQSLFHDTTGSYNTATGYRALFNDTSGYSNTADGYEALYSDTTGIRNTAVGNGALLHNNASSNTAIGWAALFSNTTGTFNTANGVSALYSNTIGYRNTATGDSALFKNTSGYANTANGFLALYANTQGHDNSAFGLYALEGNTTGNWNTGIGEGALQSNTTGYSNTGIGHLALFSNTGGYQNTATGDGALQSNTTINGESGHYNTANGYQALYSNTTGYQNTAVGAKALQNLLTSNANTALGYGAGSGVTTATDVICIGADGANVDNSCYIRNIYGAGVGGGNVAVYVDSAGKLGTTLSSRRFKKEIQPMDSASEAILALKPVTFQYKSDKSGTPQFGLIAEEVAKINPDLIVRDEKGELYSVRYDAVNAMLLNEFLKEHQKVQKLEAALAAVNERLKQQDAKIDKVNARVELAKPAPQTANN